MLDNNCQKQKHQLLYSMQMHDVNFVYKFNYSGKTVRDM